MFKLQRGLLAEYHITKPTTFYGGQQAWNVPNDPTVSQAVFQPPYYQTIKLPETDTANFSLTTTYVPKGRQNLAAFMAVNADARSDDYGQLTILQLQSETQIDGPAQVANNFEANPSVAQELSLLRQGDADTVTGNLLTLPVGGGLLYVQPVYVQRASGEAAFPLLQKVLVSFGSQIGYADTLQEALDQIFQGESGAETGEEPGTGRRPRRPRALRHRRRRRHRPASLPVTCRPRSRTRSRHTTMPRQPNARATGPRTAPLWTGWRRRWPGLRHCPGIARR